MKRSLFMALAYCMASTYLVSPCIQHQKELFCFEYWIKG